MSLWLAKDQRSTSRRSGKREWRGRRGRAQQAEGRFRMNGFGAEGKFQLGLKCGIGRRHAH